MQGDGHREEACGGDLSVVVSDHARVARRNPMEVARALESLRATMTVPQISAETGMSTNAIYDRLALLQLTESEQAAVESGRMSQTQGARIARDRAAAPGQVRRTECAFNPAHRLAPFVHERCTHLATERRNFGGTGCAECWEAVIRDDALGLLPPVWEEPFNEVKVRRFVHEGRVLDWNKDLTVAEQDAVLGVLRRRGASCSQIAAHIGVSKRTVERWRAAGRGTGQDTLAVADALAS